MLDQYLLLLFDRHPRRMKVIFNTVANRKTQATLFWAKQYGILNWLGADRGLNQQQFNQWVGRQLQSGIMEADQQTAWLTSLGAANKESFLQQAYQPHFDQWTWLVNPQEYANRFLLGGQALSHYLHQQKHYVPLNLSLNELSLVQQWVQTKGLASAAARDIFQIADQLDRIDSTLAALFSNQLFGYHVTGWSSQQAAAYFGVSEESIYVMDRDIWLFVAHYVQQNSPSWGQLMNNFLAKWPISDSAMQTLQLLERHSLKEVAHLRHLKLSTIRDHLLEAAIIIPNYLDWDRVLPVNERAILANRYQGFPADWQFQVIDPAAKAQEFFEFRLYQIYRSQRDHG